MSGSGLRERNRQAAMADVQKVAMRMMRSAGFANVTVEQIAEASGVSPSTVYRYFGTKEALVLWGDRPMRLAGHMAGLKVGKKRTSVEAFIEAATTVYADDSVDLLAQLSLVFMNDDLATAFVNGLMGQRQRISEVLATQRGVDVAGGRDVALAGALLGMLIAVLERWQASDGGKSLSKQLAKAQGVVTA